MLLRGKGPITYLIAAGGSQCNYWQNYVKQIVLPINQILWFSKAEGEFCWFEQALPLTWDGASKVVCVDRRLAKGVHPSPAPNPY